MEHGGTYTGATYPGEEKLQLAKRLCTIPEFAAQGAEAFFDWSNDLIIIYAEGMIEAKKLPLTETLKQYEEQLK